jgi:hypothetical protein
LLQGIAARVLAAGRVFVRQIACSSACSLSTSSRAERRKVVANSESTAKKPKTASLQIRIEEEVRQQLDHYAEFIDASPSYVVTEALKLLFKRDEEFKRWSTQHTNHNNNHKPKKESPCLRLSS